MSTLFAFCQIHSNNFLLSGKVIRRLSVKSKSKSRRVKSATSGLSSPVKSSYYIKSDEKVVAVSSSASELDSSQALDRSNSNRFKVKRQIKVQRGVSVVKVKVKKSRTQVSSTNVLSEKSDIDGAGNKLLARSINDVSAFSQVDAGTSSSKKAAGRVSESPSSSLQVKQKPGFEKSVSTKHIASVGRSIKSTISRPVQQYHDSLLYICPESYDCPYGFKHADFEPFLAGSKSIVNIRNAADLDKVVIIDAYGDIEVVAAVTTSATD